MLCMCVSVCPHPPSTPVYVCARISEIDVDALCRLPTRMGVVVTINDEDDGTACVLGAGVVDWISCVVSASPAAKDVHVDVFNPYEATNLPTGSVRLQIRLHPRLGTDLSATSAARSLASQVASKTKLDVLRYVDVAKLWWRDYCSVRECHSHRRVSLMAKNEFRQRLPVCCFLRIQRPGRSLPSPRDAARFVSLFHAVETQSNSASLVSTSVTLAEDVWCTAPTIIARRAGTGEELAMLLCSLFLGFGLDAYVCIGLDGLGHRCAMVLTRPSSKKVVLWDPVSGKPYGGREAGEGAMSVSVAPMTRVHCCFNTEYIFANQQADDCVTSLSWSLDEQARWASLHVSPLTRTVVGCDAVVLSPPASRDVAEVTEKSLEERLKRELFHERESVAQVSGRNVDISMRWDERLSMLLMPALEAYEQEARSGVTFGNSEFQQSIKRSTPVGHTFKGFPFHANHTDARRLAASMLNEPACALILGTIKDGVRFALRCRVTCYPNDVLSVWVMLAVCYRGVDS